MIEVDPPQIAGFTDLVPIGRGGFSTVYSATQSGIERRVAIKVLELGLSDIHRFERECRTLGALSGVPGIVSVLQTAVTAGGQPCIVMQLMDGGSLGDRLRATGPLDVDQVVRNGTLLCTALEHAHRANVFHRDIKPENILFHGEQVAVADFGIALVDDLELRSQTIDSLSPPHAPPERFTDGHADPVSGDVYSLGTTLYAALAGTAPFGTTADGGLAGLIQRVTSAPLPPIDRADVPSALLVVLGRATAKEPSHRFGSMAAFGAALSTVDASPVDEATVERPRRSPTLIAAAPTDPAAPQPTVMRNRAVEASHGSLHANHPPAPHLHGSPVPAPTVTSVDRRERGGAARTLWICAAVLLTLTLAAGAFLVGRSTLDDDLASTEDATTSTTTVATTAAPETVPAPATAVPPTVAAAVESVPPTTAVVAPTPAPARPRPTTTTRAPAPLPISEATTAVDRYLASASGTDEDAFAAMWSYPIEQHYKNTDVSEATLREANRRYWEKYSDIDFTRAGATEVSEVDGGWRTVTAFEFSMLQVSDGTPRCGLHAITLEFDHDWLIHKASESNLRPDGC